MSLGDKMDSLSNGADCKNSCSVSKAEKGFRGRALNWVGKFRLLSLLKQHL
jgi:hypothetical protein